ncbi:MAG: tRNA (guanosine(37)-N1)-methyltransferase TrmD [Phototrophicaceae bacterium]|jgi:tRNA (guanine37-N1)-methyltransferase
MRIDVFTLFPEMFTSVMHHSMMVKAQEIGALQCIAHDIRQYANNKHRKVDDTPYGGGGGMILQAPPVVDAVEQVLGEALPRTRVLLMTPVGRVFSHALAEELAAEARLAIVCAHYEGMDERVTDTLITDLISIGDYVLTGGELPALVIVDAVARFLPGVLGAEGAQYRDSHADGLLEGPQYTRPRVYRGIEVPQVLQNGNHGEIERWRRLESLRRTWRHRPDLLLKAPLSDAERYFLAVLANEDAQRR